MKIPKENLPHSLSGMLPLGSILSRYSSLKPLILSPLMDRCFELSLVGSSSVRDIAGKEEKIKLNEVKPPLNMTSNMASIKHDIKHDLHQTWPPSNMTSNMTSIKHDAHWQLSIVVLQFIYFIGENQLIVIIF